jgi:membrane protease YdiL (CAAX protease family)
MNQRRTGIDNDNAIAATSVLGSQFLFRNDVQTGSALWFLAIVLWALLNYTIFTTLTVKRAKPTLGVGINGGWLLSVVAAQYLSILSGQLAGHVAGRRHALYLDHLADLLPLHIFSVGIVRSDPALLDQYGFGGYFHLGRHSSDR